MDRVSKTDRCPLLLNHGIHQHNCKKATTHLFLHIHWHHLGIVGKTLKRLLYI